MISIGLVQQFIVFAVVQPLLRNRLRSLFSSFSLNRDLVFRLALLAPVIGYGADLSSVVMAPCARTSLLDPAAR